MGLREFIHRVLWGGVVADGSPPCYPCVCPVCGAEIMIAPVTEPTPGDADFALCPECRSVVCRTSEGEMAAFVPESRLRGIEEQVQEVRFENRVLKDANAAMLKMVKDMEEESEE